MQVTATAYNFIEKRGRISSPYKGTKGLATEHAKWFPVVETALKSPNHFGRMFVLERFV